MDPHLFTDEQRMEIKNIVHEALTEWVKSYGLGFRNIITGLAALLVALAFIGKAIAWLLALVGFTYLGK